MTNGEDVDLVANDLIVHQIVSDDEPAHPPDRQLLAFETHPVECRQVALRVPHLAGQVPRRGRVQLP